MEAKVFMLWRNDEILIGTVDEVINRYANPGVLLEDIIAELAYDSEDETTIKLVIRR